MKLNRMCPPGLRERPNITENILERNMSESNLHIRAKEIWVSRQMENWNEQHARLFANRERARNILDERRQRQQEKNDAWKEAMQNWEAYGSRQALQSRSLGQGYSEHSLGGASGERLCCVPAVVYGGRLTPLEQQKAFA